LSNGFTSSWAIALAVTGCQTPYAIPDYTKVVVSAPESGRVRISGKPGAIRGGNASTVTLTIVREGGVVPTAYHVAHITGGLPVSSGFAEVLPDGSFTEAVLGSPERPVQPGDELNITPIHGISQVGPVIPVPIP
jgi:hypothetical protein